MKNKPVEDEKCFYEVEVFKNGEHRHTNQQKKQLRGDA